MKRTIPLVVVLFFACPHQADTIVIGYRVWYGIAFLSPPGVEPASTYVNPGELQTGRSRGEIWRTLGMEKRARRAARMILQERLDSTTAGYYADLIIESTGLEGLQGYEEILASQVMRESWGIIFRFILVRSPIARRTSPSPS